MIPEYVFTVLEMQMVGFYFPNVVCACASRKCVAVAYIPPVLIYFTFIAEKQIQSSEETL